MARSDARLLRFAAVAVGLILTIFILSKGSSTTYVASTGSSSAVGSSPAGQSSSNSPKSVKMNSVGEGVITHTSFEQGLKKQSTRGTVKACFVSLARNRDLWSLIGSIRHVEDRFNKKFGYDWVFLNDEVFSEEFKRTTTALVTGETKYGLIPKEHWSFPDWIDLDKAAKTRQDMKEKKIIYGDSVSYRHMCRFESGFFYRHELLKDYEYYWRVEPDVKLYCDIDYDIFQFMKDNGKKYGFTISLHEYEATIETLWSTTRDFMKEHPDYIHNNNMMDFISDDGGASYNLCHFWSNFEVGSLDFWRGEAYTSYFEYLDKAGGFFYERWGDAPVHSIAAALFLDRSEIHYFPDVGYYHVPFHNCPLDQEYRLQHKCMCNPKDDFTFKGYSCGGKFFSVNQMEKPANWEEYS
jgi:alpha 1,2-mannosyltransferase